MPAKRTAAPKKFASTANLGSGAKLWLAADSGLSVDGLPSS